MIKQLTALLGTALLLAGCAGVGLQDAGVPGKSWQRVAYQEEGDDPVEILEEGLKDLQDAGAGIWWILGVGLGAAYIINESDDEEDENRLSYARSEQLQRSPQPLRRWQRNLEAAAAARVSIWQPAPYAAAAAEPASGAPDSRLQAQWGALAIDSRQGDQWGWAIDHTTLQAAEERALSECGRGCTVVMTFRNQCAAYAADTQAGSTAYGWARAQTGADARSTALSECGSRGGTSCTVRVWGCSGI